MIRTCLSRMFVAGLAGLAVFAVTAGAHAFQIFTDRTAWANAVAASPLAGPVIDDPFDNHIVGADSITFDSGVVSTGTPASARFDNLVAGGQYSGGVRGNLTSTSSALYYVTIAWGFPMPIFAFGADWVGAATHNGLTVTGDFDGAGDATISFNTALGGHPGTGFLGVVGDAAFSTITFDGENLRPRTGELFDADNLSFAKAMAVPEPAGIALFGVGLAGLAWRRRRARRRG